MKELSAGLKELCESSELMRLAYTDGRGYARVVPVWYVLMNGAYYLGTYTTSAKAKAIKREPRVGWVIDGGNKPKYHGVSFYGQALEVSDAQEREAVYRALGDKYFGTTDDPTFLEIFGKVDDAQTVYLRLTPEDGTSWEY
jgi:nitroimidazol reductase NimA-like FMN-containing flavoprotein (pyridoxamine 5'-phosphate oxidase superfamily)